jgi:hypothetical protein
VDAWGPCNATCNGNQSRVVRCVDSSGAVVSDVDCGGPSSTPPRVQQCNVGACPADVSYIAVISRPSVAALDGRGCVVEALQRCVGLYVHRVLPPTRLSNAGVVVAAATPALHCAASLSDAVAAHTEPCFASRARAREHIRCDERLVWRLLVQCVLRVSVAVVDRVVPCRCRVVSIDDIRCSVSDDCMDDDVTSGVAGRTLLRNCGGEQCCWHPRVAVHLFPQVTPTCTYAPYTTASNTTNTTNTTTTTTTTTTTSTLNSHSRAATAATACCVARSVQRRRAHAHGFALP